MSGQMNQMRMSDGAEIGVYHVKPEGERRGGLVLVQEIFGVTDHIRDMAEEYAADGYEVLAPALFDREHPGFEKAACTMVVGADAGEVDVGGIVALE